MVVLLLQRLPIYNQCLLQIRFVNLVSIYGEVYLIHIYVIKFVSDMWHYVDLPEFSSNDKTDCHNITDIWHQTPIALNSKGSCFFNTLVSFT